VAVLLTALFQVACSSDRSGQELPIGNVDAPKPGESGAKSLRVSGWALAKGGIARIDLYLDGKFAASSQTSVSRPDVQQAHPEYDGSVNSGFDMQLDLAGKPAGAHELTIQARSRDDAVRELCRFPIVVAR
jgi:hypothetical protein